MTIQGYAEGIKDGIFEGEDAERGLNVMVAEINRLKKIINEIILLAKLDSEADIYHVKKVNVEQFIEKVMERAIPIANDQNKEIILTKITNHILSFDEGGKMLQAVMNIVTNAIRHAHQRVEISVRTENNQLRIEVVDDGNGIDEDVIQKLFHRFVKGKSGGETGLGLAIARAIVERSGGIIKAENTINKGAKFSILFTKHEKNTD